MTLRRLIRVAGLRWEERRRFATLGSWALDLYNRVLGRLPVVPMPMRRRVCRVYLSGRPHPVLARLGSTDFAVLEEIFCKSEYEPVTSMNLGEAPLIVDLGANVGFSVRRWQEQWPRATIVAVEPDSGNAELCRRNGAVLPDLPVPAVIEACVAGRSRRVTMGGSRGEWAFTMRETSEDPAGQAPGAGAGHVPPGGPSVVDALTLPDVLARAGIPPDRPIDLLKCDIEGTERELFEHCGDWLPRVRCAMVELHAPYRVEDLQEAIRRSGETFECELHKDIPGVQVVVLTRPPAH
ncbi:MAG: FkbM family methyltransferase [Phycisphaeraceae bacterium]|nr:FkbM family methyltransferase [Phycisphaeraceae bacterium]MBX3406994.1 FkbM family methyltransferase [Phycisphaeraceae bacterium]